MECFNCGNESEMEVYMMINGKIKKMNICMDCYKEQMKSMMEMLADEHGNINPEKIQKKMFEFFKENKDEFENFIADAINDANFKIEDLNMQNIDVSSFNFENFGVNLENIDFDKILKSKIKKQDENIESNIKVDYSSNEKKEVIDLIKSAEKKRILLNQSVEKEDYLSASILRDEMREINRKIMIIREFEKEVN